MSESQDYKAGDRILAVSKSIWYEAKILGIGEKKNKRGFKIHYKGWAAKHDEIIPFDDVGTHIKPFSEEELAKSKAILAQALSEQKQKGKKKSLQDSKREVSTENDGSESTEKSSKRGAKRKLEEAEKNFSNHKVEKILDLPEPLKKILRDDNSQVDRQNMIYRLPVKYTVSDIINEYAKSLNGPMNENNEATVEYENGKPTLSAMVQSSKGLLDYFNYTMPTQLLYKSERSQYENSKAEETQVQSKKNNKIKNEVDSNDKEPFKPSNYYGLPHLLRLLTRIEGYIKMAGYTDRVQSGILNTIIHFVIFLNKNHQKYCKDLEYQAA